jgi:hypothetical protein
MNELAASSRFKKTLPMLLNNQWHGVSTRRDFVPPKPQPAVICHSDPRRVMDVDDPKLLQSMIRDKITGSARAATVQMTNCWHSCVRSAKYVQQEDKKGKFHHKEYNEVRKPLRLLLFTIVNNKIKPTCKST